MASKFQNRMVGTVILVAIGVIVLPGLLDGKKKHFKEEFAAIPLVPKPGDQQDNEALPPVTQTLPAQPPAGAGNAVSSADAVASNSAAQANATAGQQPVVTPPPIHTSVAKKNDTLTTANESVKPKPVEVVKPKAPEPVKPKPKPVETVKRAEPERSQEPVAAPERPAPEPARNDAPTGQAFIVQLGALKNADKVNQIVAQLRLSGYRAWTVPSTPVAGQITRIYVGPDASKAKMQEALGELRSVSGLSGVVKPYSAR
ncbi:cell division protein DedD [Pantoea sp. A4]|uniref:cell division protein DedD n=1 Tax=Pantoea sp. A4 TaxID=1225184 RepID=UPI00037F1787|nr:cell division protein DedD [Pantoea sp. A4]